jgi:glycosyltransferase involved in cell wall biosynthesis
MSGAARVSIIVPLAGGPAQALRCFEGIASQPEDPPYEVIVVDNASLGLEGLLASLGGDVQVVRSERRLSFSAATRLGAERAHGDIVVLVRDGAAPAAGWLAPLVDALAETKVGLAASSSENGREVNPVAAWSVAVRAELLRSASDPGVPDELSLAALSVAVAQQGLEVVSASASRISAPGARTGGGRRILGQAPELTVVIPTLDAASERVRSRVAALQATTDVAHEIVIVDNGCPPQGFTAPVNAGLRAARTPYLVVMNDDVDPLPGWWAPLRSTLEAGAAVVFPLTVDGPMRTDFAAWCFAMSAQSVAEFEHGPGEFFDPALVIWYQDTDLLLRLREAGRPPVLVETSRIRHGLSETVGSEDPELAGWIRQQIQADRDAFLRKHPAAPLQGYGLVAA